MSAQIKSYPFSNLQLELINLYDRNIDEADLKAIKDFLAQYFAKKATLLANKVWDEKGLDAETILNTHIRTPSKKK